MIIEKEILNYLNSEDVGLTAYAERPNNPPTEYCLVARVSGEINETIRRATVDIDVYSDTLYNASVLNEQLITAMNDFVHDSVSKIDCVGDAQNMDLQNKIYAYRTTWQIYFY